MPLCELLDVEVFPRRDEAEWPPGTPERLANREEVCPTGPPPPARGEGWLVEDTALIGCPQETIHPTFGRLVGNEVNL
jgi:hypothetical protein